MDVTSTIKALRERCPTFGNQIYGAARFAAQDWKNPNPASFPAAYVFTLHEVPADSQRTETDYYQEIVATVRIVVGVPNTDDERGQHASVTLETLKDEIFHAILGWSPTGDPQAIYEYAGCDILDLNRAVLLMSYDFEITYAIGVNDTRIPAQLDEDCGRFDTLDMSVDKIETPPGAPDGQEDAHLRLEGLYGEST